MRYRYFSISLLLLFWAGCQSTSDTPEWQAEPAAVFTTSLIEQAAITPGEAQRLLAESPEQVRLIDIRKPDAFQKGHPAGAINIPAAQLLEPNYWQLVHNPEVTLILFGDPDQSALIPWAVLTQAGCKNVHLWQERPLEIATADYSQAFKTAQQQDLKALEAVAPPPPPKKIIQPKKKVVAEEEEGC